MNQLTGKLPEEVFILRKFDIRINRERVFKFLQCYEGSSAYDDMLEEYKELEPKILKMVSPAALLAFMTVGEHQETKKLPAGTRVLFAVTTVGKELSALSNQYFAEDEYLKGILSDAMADNCLFSMDHEVSEFITDKCKELHIGISRRMEAPKDFPMSWQKIAAEVTKADENIGMKVTSGMMLDPLKSNCQVYVVSDDENEHNLYQDCRNCGNVTCGLRHIPDVAVTIVNPSGKKSPDIRKESEDTILCDSDVSLLSSLTKNGYYISAACGGRGSCGKCGVRFLTHATPTTGEDKKAFSEEKIKDGWRLSCRSYPLLDCRIELPENLEDNFEVVAESTNSSHTKTAETEFSDDAGSANRRPDDKESGSALKTRGALPAGKKYDIAVDIGTTTLASALLSEDGTLIDTWTGVNHQRAYGADVISRILASNEGEKEALRSSIRCDLCRGFSELLTQNQIPSDKVRRIAIAGNTTMGHLLMGFSCEGLGVVPFTPVDIRLMRRAYRDVFGAGDGQSLLPVDAEVILLPGITTYVGADIVAGIYSCGMYELKEPSLLIDLGTNGEMALGNEDRLLVTSTAAGPAFEGGNISCGMGSVRGAICGVNLTWESSKRDVPEVHLKTIGDVPPVGLCGTGVIETCAELLRSGIIDETGLMTDPYFDEGFLLAQTADGKRISYTQKDVREIQLAKSAVRAGVETLLLRYGISYEDVAHVYLAGGFGFKMNKEKAIEIGMLPKELKDKIEAVGNSSLSGTIRYLQSTGKEDRAQKDAEGILKEITQKAQEVSLAEDPHFADFYMEYMMFGEE